MKKLSLALALTLVLVSPISLVMAQDTMMKDDSSVSDSMMQNDESSSDSMMAKDDSTSKMMEETMEPQEVKTFDLFWPVAAGKVPGDSLYFLKTLKENLRELLIFSKYQKTDYNIVLVEKRMAEAEKLLLENNDVNNFSKALDMAESKRMKVLDLLSQLKADGTDTSSLYDRFQSSLNKQTELLNYWKTKTKDNAQEVVNKSLEEVSASLSKLQS